MRIVRYELELVDYQQVQPLWPGTILAVKPGRCSPGYLEHQKIDMWCVDAEIPVDECPPTQIPILGVWIVGTGNPMPDRFADDCMIRDWPIEPYGFEAPRARRIDYRDTCVMANGLVWHVFTATTYVEPMETGLGEVSSVDDIAAKVAERRRIEMQRVADMPREIPRDV